MKLLIFDIDGTLTHLDGATRRAFDAAFRAAFGTPAQISDIPMHGRTDPMIFRDCFAASGLGETWNVAYQEFRPHYLRELPACIAASERKRLLPGVPELLSALAASSDQPALALGTGNMEDGARLKIGHFDLNRYFPVGGFGDRHEVRTEIMRDAVANSCVHYARNFDLNNTWVIGDTIYDIEGGRAIGARTLGVATGGAFSADQLRAAEGDVVIDDLSDTRAVLDIFGID
ncbi:haloacid dehalogenase-like hydrolase [candidate division KSB1 bacterium]|nr:haloacid dehalogenase-like hydrolase [candidate division KSB1 bacterium]